MQASRRNNPCPICGRVKDSDCRWNADTIFCHQGTSNAPPSHLKIGDIIQIDNKEWALLSLKSGFDGAAALFKPHKELLGKKHCFPSARNDQQVEEEEDFQEVIEETKQLIEDFLNVAQKALNTGDFQNAPPDELGKSFVLIEEASTIAKELREYLLFNSELKEWTSLFNEAAQDLTYLKSNADHFRKNMLGENL